MNIYILIILFILTPILLHIKKSRSTPIKLFLSRSPSNLNKLSKCPTLFQTKAGSVKGKNEDENTKGYTINHEDNSIISLAKYVPCFWLLSEHAHNVWAAYIRKFWDLPSERCGAQ